MMKAIYLEDLKEYFKNRKIIFVLAILLFIIITVYASGFLQVAYLLFFKPQNLIPFPITITYYLLFITLPILAILLGHDVISSEIENNHIRGIISKISRDSFLLGKFLSLLTILASISFILLLSSSIYTYIKVNQLDIIHPLLFFLYLFLYTAALSAVSIFFSSLFSKSTTPLFVTTLFHLAVLYMNLNKPAYLSLLHYMNNIITLENIILPLSVFIIYFIVFISAALLIFRVRDL